MFMGTEPRSVAKTVRSIGPIRSIRRPPSRSVASTITVLSFPKRSFSQASRRTGDAPAFPG
jgi:hypothetical protein